MIFQRTSRKRFHKAQRGSSKGEKERKRSIFRECIVLALIGACFGFVLLSEPQSLLFAESLTDCSPSTNIENSIENATCLDAGDSNERAFIEDRNAKECLLHIEPNEYFRLLQSTLVGLPNAGACNFGNGCQPPHKPYKEKDRQFGNDWPPYGFTMIGKERLKIFRAAIMEVNRNHIPGGIAEFGVWRGGAMILAAAVMKDYYQQSQQLQQSQQPHMERDLFLFDAFAAFGEYGGAEDFLAVSLEDVQRNMEMFGFGGDNRIHYVKGLFSDTTKEWTNRVNDVIAVLRVDGNFYSSYQDVLYAMYDKVPVGGIVIFDDVFHHHYKEVMQCWIDFKRDHGIPEELVRIDDVSGWFRKRTLVQIDQSKKRTAKQFTTKEKQLRKRTLVQIERSKKRTFSTKEKQQ